MPELIDKAKLLEYLAAIKPDEYVSAYGEAAADVINHVEKYVAEMSTIEAEPVRHGRWIVTPLPNSRVAKCSLCGFWQRTNGDDKTGKHLIHNAVYRYCAGCGARMDADHIADDSKKVGGADNG